MHIFHKWALVKCEGKYKYYECRKCEVRKVKVVTSSGYQPINFSWLTFTEYHYCPKCNHPLPPKSMYKTLGFACEIFKKVDYEKTWECRCGEVVKY